MRHRAPYRGRAREYSLNDDVADDDDYLAGRFLAAFAAYGDGQSVHDALVEPPIFGARCGVDDSAACDCCSTPWRALRRPSQINDVGNVFENLEPRAEEHGADA